MNPRNFQAAPVLVRLALLIGLAFAATCAHASDRCSELKGTNIQAQDEQQTFLGSINYRFDPNSIFNPVGQYGNRYGKDSIWNPYSMYGNHFNPRSPFNANAQAPPAIMRGDKIVGYLSANPAIPQSISPQRLKSQCEDQM